MYRRDKQIAAECCLSMVFQIMLTDIVFINRNITVIIHNT